MRILVVEDDRLLGDALVVGLRQAGFTVDWLQDGVAADEALQNEDYAAVVLDLGLPRRPGLEVLRRQRARRNPAPVLILTARDTVPDRIEGLDEGADDYLTKPFDMGELAARLRALVRRATGSPMPRLMVQGIELDPAAHRVSFRNLPVELSAKEFAVLHVLMSNAGRVLSRRQLEEHLYAWGEEIESNAVEVYIHNLRRKLSPGLIHTIRGVGYIIRKDRND
jgi:two-component system OmpR family response regulator/two-component system response regulator QseB